MEKTVAYPIDTSKHHVCSWRLVGVFQGGIYTFNVYQLIYQCRICDEVKQEIRDWDFKLKDADAVKKEIQTLERESIASSYKSKQNKEPK